MIQYIVFLWAIVWLLWVLSYVRDTLQGKTKPNRVSRLLRSIAPMIATWAALSDGVRRAVLPVFISWFGPFLVFISSFVNKKAYRKLEKSDYLCWLFSLLALILRYITKDPAIAIMFAIISDALAAIPTLIKWRQHPETESPIAFAWWLFNALTSFFALKKFWFTEIAFPLYLVIIDILLMWAIILWRRKQRKK